MKEFFTISNCLYYCCYDILFYVLYNKKETKKLDTINNDENTIIDNDENKKISITCINNEENKQINVDMINCNELESKEITADEFKSIFNDFVIIDANYS